MIVANAAVLNHLFARSSGWRRLCSAGPCLSAIKARVHGEGFKHHRPADNVRPRFVHAMARKVDGWSSFGLRTLYRSSSQLE